LKRNEVNKNGLAKLKRYQISHSLYSKITANKTAA